MRLTRFFIWIIALTPIIGLAQKNKDAVLAKLESKTEYYGDIAHQIWDLAEMGYLEEKSSALLQKTLSDAGFSIEKGVAGIPTAFVAEYGSGSPVIAILGEYDALPGLSQQAVAEKKSANKVAGHACGHHLFGTASSASAIAVKDWMKANKIQGTIRFYGCPAEEGGSGKVYMVREGLFNDVDVAFIGIRARRMQLVQVLLWQISPLSFVFMGHRPTLQEHLIWAAPPWMVLKP